jgi:hypothetical protein
MSAQFDTTDGGKLLISDGRVIKYASQGEMTASFAIADIGGMTPDPGMNESGLKICGKDGAGNTVFDPPLLVCEFEGRDTGDRCIRAIQAEANSSNDEGEGGA